VITQQPGGYRLVVFSQSFLRRSKTGRSFVPNNVAPEFPPGATSWTIGVSWTLKSGATFDYLSGKMDFQKAELMAENTAFIDSSNPLQPKGGVYYNLAIRPICYAKVPG